MFHFLVKYNGWSKNGDSIGVDRVFEYTDEILRAEFKPNNKLATERMCKIPALFVTESNGDGEKMARVGSIYRISVSDRNMDVRYSFDDSVPPISNFRLEKMSEELKISSFEFSRTHWAIKDADLFKVLYKSQIPILPMPKVFRLEKTFDVDENLFSIMMPFSSKYDPVLSSLKAVAKKFGMQCLRADNIWDREEVIQDIVSLISKSRVIVCDCSGKNPNVFYETGVAHTLGRDTILISQSERDVPFDLRHLRYVKYVNTPKGRRDLVKKVSQRVSTLLGK